jgi:Ion transport protein
MFELFVKLGGRGFALYFEEKFNWFDFSVLLVSCVDITLSNTVTLSQSGSGAITAMRVLRIIRIFRLAKVWKDL